MIFALVYLITVALFVVNRTGHYKINKLDDKIKTLEERLKQHEHKPKHD